MKKKSKTEKPASSAESPAKTAKESKKIAAPKKENSKAPMAFDIVGKVESILVKNGSDPGIFEFGLRTHAGKRHRLRLKSEPFALNVMAPIVASAHANDSKIGVRLEAAADGLPLVVEVESRPRLGKNG